MIQRLSRPSSQQTPKYSQHAQVQENQQLLKDQLQSSLQTPKTISYYDPKIYKKSNTPTLSTSLSYSSCSQNVSLDKKPQRTSNANNLITLNVPQKSILEMDNETDVLPNYQKKSQNEQHDFNKQCQNIIIPRNEHPFDQQQQQQKQQQNYQEVNTLLYEQVQFIQNFIDSNQSTERAQDKYKFHKLNHPSYPQLCQLDAIQTKNRNQPSISSIGQRDQPSRSSHNQILMHLPKQKRSLYTEWNGQQEYNKWQTKTIAPNKLKERFVYESSQEIIPPSISMNNTSRQRDFVSQIQTLPGASSIRELREQSFTPEPKRIHPLNLYQHSSTAQIQQQKNKFIGAQESSVNQNQSAVGEAAKKYESPSLKSFVLDYANNSSSNQNGGISLKIEKEVESNNKSSKPILCKSQRSNVQQIQQQIGIGRSAYTSRNNSSEKNQFISHYKDDYTPKTSNLDILLQTQTQRGNSCDSNQSKLALQLKNNYTHSSYQENECKKEKYQKQQQQSYEDQAQQACKLNQCQPQISQVDLIGFQNYNQRENSSPSRKKPHPMKLFLLHTSSNFLFS